MTRPLLVDLFCCEGGASEGYARAGFEVVGWDVRRWPRYRHPLTRCDLSLLDEASFAALCAELGVAAVHASPPCQKFTELNSRRDRHVDLIPKARALCLATGLPYVIENVRAARPELRDPVTLCGQMFGLHMVTSAGRRFDLYRPRLFEAPWLPERYRRNGYIDDGLDSPLANVFGGHLRARSGEHRTGKGTGRTVDFPGEDRPTLARQLMGMPWATMAGMSEAVPPAYTQWLGEKLLAHMDGSLS